MNAQFLESVFDSNIQHPNFFNGRILTAQDLQEEQAANLNWSRYLAQAMGEGVVYGLNVTLSKNRLALEVSSGLAINRRGDALPLPTDTTVELVAQTPATTTSPFAPCGLPPAMTLTSKLDTDYYLLALTNATQPSTEKASHNGSNGQPTCTSRYEQLGVQFKLVPLTNNDFVTPILPNDPKSRSRLAHACFGTDTLARYASNPFDMPAQYGLVDNLRTGSNARLTQCDVPLAVLQFQGNQVQFVDMWAVRRPCVSAIRLGCFPSGQSQWIDEILTQFVSSRRAMEAAAFFLQFQNHLEDLRNNPNLTPANVSAATYFEYLPAAGFLPIQRNTQDSQRFNLSTFFGLSGTFNPPEFENPTLIRSFFHTSLFVEPIKPSQDKVDVYTFKGSPADAPYVLFVRRPPIALEQAVGGTSGSGQQPSATATGDLWVTVLAESGNLVSSDRIQSVQAVNQSNGKIETAQCSIFEPQSVADYPYLRWLYSTIEKMRTKYGTSNANTPSSVERQAVNIKDLTLYYFNDLPVGTYTVKANPVNSKNYISKTTQVSVQPDSLNFVEAILKAESVLEIEKPSGSKQIPDKRTLPWGVVTSRYAFDPKWGKLIKEWQAKWPPPGPDPSPENWHKVDDSELERQIEDILGSVIETYPSSPIVNPRLYISRSFNPTQSAETFNAFVQLQDGLGIPVIVVTIDNALKTPSTVDRTGIKDFDRSIVNRLADFGLDRLDVFVSAPVSLLATVLEKSPEYIESLMSESRSVLQEDFRNGFMDYVGISKTESDILKGVYKDVNGNADLVSFANASKANIIKALGDQGIKVNESFVGRLLSDVQSSVLQKSYTLSGTSMSADQQKALKDIGIATNKDFREQAATQEGLDTLKQTLKVEEATLNRFLQEAAVDFAVGKFMATPDRSIATFKKVSPDVAAKLAEAGYSSAKTLAMAETESSQLANQVGVSIEELAPILTNAANYVGESYGALITEGVSKANLTSQTKDALTNELKAQYVRPAQVARATTADLQAISVTVDNQATSLDANTATTINELMTRFQNNVLRGGIQ